MIDFRIAIRSLLKTPVVTGVAVVSLALGIGANAAIFSLFERMLLRPLPVEEPERLVNLSGPGPKPGSQTTSLPGGMDDVFSYPMFRDLQAADSAFEAIAAHRNIGVNLAYKGSTTSAEGFLVSGNYFSTLGLLPAAGRLFTPEDDRTPGAHPVVVLSHAYWQSHFASNPDVVGEILVVNGQPMTIVGVAPRGFQGTVLGIKPRVFVPITMRGAMIPGWEGFEDRLSYWVYLFGRLAPGATLDAASASINPTYTNVIRNVELELQEGMSDATRERFAEKEIALEAGQRGQSVLHEEVHMPLAILLGVTGFVLLIAAANLINLLLVRAKDRASEIAVRLSIGARRWQLVGQFLAESFLLALAGSALGLLVAQGTLRLMASILPTDVITLELELSPAMWFFLIGLVAITGLVGLFPALHATRSDLVSALRGSSGQPSGSRGALRFRAAMATFQIALSVALLASAGLFIKSLVNVSRVDLGLDVGHLATFSISPELNGYAPEASRGLFMRLEEELSALPGVSTAVASRVPLVANSNWGSSIRVEGYPIGPDVDNHSQFNEVGPGFFRTVGIGLLAGRELEPRDALEAPKVALVNEAFTRKFDLGRDAVGKRMAVGGGADEELDVEIVGLVRNAAYSEVKDEVPPVFYLAYRQNEKIGRIYFYVRTQSAPDNVLETVRGVVAGLDPNLPIDNLHTMKVQVEENIALDRLLSTLSTAFALVATLLAAIGLYGVLAYSVVQRRREIGLRMALGADAGRVRGMVLKQVGWMTLTGAILGLAAALGIGKVAQALLFELDGADPAVLATATLAICAVALGAGLLPAQRAASVDPMRALREE